MFVAIEKHLATGLSLHCKTVHYPTSPSYTSHSSGAYMSQKIDELCTSGSKHENLYTGVLLYADFKF